ncbi:hypothetical protein Barb4_01782 [Bacteroidales bacterium Barb4]|nr:hypothetical protein Barb4_01782 [Bacteroidales bacterium Barb4]
MVLGAQIQVLNATNLYKKRKIFRRYFVLIFICFPPASLFRCFNFRQVCFHKLPHATLGYPQI